VLKHLTVEHYEALCLNGFETENTRGLIKLCIDIVNEIKAGASPEQAVKMIFKSLAKKTPVIGAGKELVAASSKGRVQDTEPIHEYDAKIVMKQCNVDLVTLNLIKDAYYKRSGVVSEIAAYLKEQNGLRLSSHRISKALDAMNLPRLKRPR
jgi:predicted Ser/Thr protein kinase